MYVQWYPLYKDTPEMRTSPINQDTMHADPSYIIITKNYPRIEDTSFNQDISNCPMSVVRLN